MFCPGSVRIFSTFPADLPNGAFLNPDGRIVVIILNDGGSAAAFNLTVEDKTVHSWLSPGAVGTYVLSVSDP